MEVRIFSFLFLIFAVIQSGDAYSLILRVKDSSDLQKKINQCIPAKSPGFKFKESNFDWKNHSASMKSIEDASLKNAGNYSSQVKCIHSQLAGTKDLSIIKTAIEEQQEITELFLEYNNRWIYGLEKKGVLSPLDKKSVSEFYISKRDLYLLILEKTQELLLKEKITKEEWEEFDDAMNSGFLSLLKLHFEFYSSLSKEARKEILEKLP